MYTSILKDSLSCSAAIFAGHVLSTLSISTHYFTFIYLFAMFIQAIQFSNAGLNGGLFTY